MRTNITFSNIISSSKIIKLINYITNSRFTTKQIRISKSIICNNFTNTITSHLEILNSKSIFNHINSCKFNKRIITISCLVKQHISSFYISSIIFKLNTLLRLTSSIVFVLIEQVYFKQTKYTSIFRFTLKISNFLSRSKFSKSFYFRRSWSINIFTIKVKLRFSIISKDSLTFSNSITFVIKAIS